MSNLVLMMEERPDGHAVMMHVDFDDGTAAHIEGGARHPTPEAARAAGLKLHALLAEVIGEGIGISVPRGARVH